MNEAVNNNILSLINKTPDSIIQEIAARVRKRRLELNLTQKSFASRAGIALPTYRRFERSGEISLRGLVLISLALDKSDDFDLLFASPSYKSIDDIAQMDKNKKRKRGNE